MTADVDFSMCRRAALKKGAQVPPLLTQGEFLMRMGILARVQQLVELDETSDEQASALVDSLKYLVEGSKMGTRFKVMSIANPALGAVTGFES
jgi:SAM-dependent MidA family methyltransferase